MSFRTFLVELNKGLQLPIYLFISKDFFFHREALRMIKSSIPADERDFNLHVFDTVLNQEDVFSFDKIIDLLNTAPFFGKRRYTVYSGNIQKLPKADFDKIVDYTENPFEGSTFVILNYGDIKKNLLNRLKNVKIIILDMKESEIPLWIKDMAKLKGFELSDEAIEYLIGLTGTNVGLIFSEIEKMSFLGKKKINIDDISEIVAGGDVYNNFDLVGALINKKPLEVFKIYNSIKDVTDSYSLIGSLNWQYCRVFKNNENKELAHKIFETLHLTDIDIKSSGREYPIEYLLYKLIKLQKGHLPSL